MITTPIEGWVRAVTWCYERHVLTRICWLDMTCLLAPGARLCDIIRDEQPVTDIIFARALMDPWWMIQPRRNTWRNVEIWMGRKEYLDRNMTMMWALAQQCALVVAPRVFYAKKRSNNAWGKNNRTCTPALGQSEHFAGARCSQNMNSILCRLGLMMVRPDGTAQID